MSYASAAPSLFSKAAAAKFGPAGYNSSRDSLNSITVPASDYIYNLGVTHFEGVVAVSNAAKGSDRSSLSVLFSNVSTKFLKGSVDVGAGRLFEHTYRMMLYIVDERLNSPAERIGKMSPWCFNVPMMIEPDGQYQLAVLSRSYPTTTSRLCSFLREVEGWDGADGQPANFHTFNDVKELLSCALDHGLREPEVVLGNDGSIGVVWAEHDWYIAHDFDGSGSYVVVAMFKDDVAASGVEKVSGFSADVLPILTKYFMDDDRTNLR